MAQPSILRGKRITALKDAEQDAIEFSKVIGIDPPNAKRTASTPSDVLETRIAEEIAKWISYLKDRITDRNTIELLAWKGMIDKDGNEVSLKDKLVRPVVPVSRPPKINTED